MMPQLPVIYICIALSGILIAAMFRHGHGRGILSYLAAFFALFAYGPVVNYLLGNTIYFGIRLQHIDEACVGFTLALAGLAAADLLKKQRTEFHIVRNPVSTRFYELYPPLLAMIFAYSLVMIVRLLPSSLSGDKISQIALAGSGHSTYLLVELCVISTFFLTRRSPLLRKLWILNLISYVVYCLATSERDFLFALFSVLLHRQLLSHRPGTSRVVVLAGLASIIAAATLFASRAGEALDISGVLNQGSLLFVDTYVIEWVPTSADHALGETYLQTITSLPPAWLNQSDTVSLSSWLVNNYAHGSNGGYGFSLSAEAYLNFGTIGIFPVFLVLGLALQAAVNQFGQGEWRSFLSVYFTAATLYSFRGDSSQLVKTLIYGAIFFGIIHICQARPRRIGKVSDEHI